MFRNILAVLLIAGLTIASGLWAGTSTKTAAPRANSALSAPIPAGAERSPGLDPITVPGMLSYQGKLTDSAGNPVPNGTFPLTFRLYPDSTGGVSFWSEVQQVQTRGGLFNCLLGKANPITALPEDGNCYLEMQIDPNPPMMPRIRIASSAYAFLARKADTAEYAVTAAPTGTAGGDLAGSYPNPTIAQKGAANRQVLKWNGSAWIPGNDSVGGGGRSDSAWVRAGGDSVLYTIRQLGIARGGSNNALYGNLTATHTNLGVGSSTGAPGQNYGYCTVGGGAGNWAIFDYATVGGGAGNTASGHNATVGGGAGNTASDWGATVVGGEGNTASGSWSTVCGLDDTAAYEYDFAVGYHSRVLTGQLNSAAFTSSTATACNQVRAQMFSTGTVVFTSDHPLDPSGKLLNQYAMGSSELVMFYRGTATIR